MNPNHYHLEGEGEQKRERKKESKKRASDKMIDPVLVFMIGSAIILLAYCVIKTSFPFNAFLGAFSAHVGHLVLLPAYSLKSLLSILLNLNELMLRVLHFFVIAFSS
ncbi:hypothetical protein MJO28_017320 [Puccinia striiformis f. sp. tritici]|nr:hypothetical protein MJO28_017320 [Puccinia striiformis f. sp. tritici]